MQDAKEREIQLQFLDEAQDHLETLDSALMELSNRAIDGGQINAALRAAHSMKGGGSLMGFSILSQLSHQLEDALKVLKVQKQTLEVDQPLETLLLSGVDCLRLVVNCDRQQRPIPPDWLQKTAQPIFAQLRDRLGEPEEENALSVLSPEDGQDITPLLFETEVEGCLNRLEALLDTANQPCLREEVLILAQELGGLGAMLQLTPFCRLCASVAYAVQSAPDRMGEIAQVAVAEWRRSQSLVLTQQLDLLPATIQVPGLDIQLDPATDPMDFLATVSTEPDETRSASTEFATIASPEPKLSFDQLEDIFDDELDGDSEDSPDDNINLDLAELPTLVGSFTHEESQELASQGTDQSLRPGTLAMAPLTVDPLIVDQTIATDQTVVVDPPHWPDDLGDDLDLEPSVLDASDLAILEDGTTNQALLAELLEDERFPDHVGDLDGEISQLMAELFTDMVDPDAPSPRTAPSVTGNEESVNTDLANTDLDTLFATVSLASDDSSSPESPRSSPRSLTTDRLGADAKDVESEGVDVTAPPLTKTDIPLPTSPPPPSVPELATAQVAAQATAQVAELTVADVADPQPSPSFAPPPDLAVAADPILAVEPSTASNLGFPVTTAPATPDPTVPDPAVTEFQLLNPQKTESPPTDEDTLSFVRVNVKHLNQLNDLLGELTIDRNGLTLYLKRLRSLVKRLNRQVRVLDRANLQLQSVYDQNVVNRVELDGPSPQSSSLLSPQSGTAWTSASSDLPEPDADALLQEAALLPSELEHQFDALEMDRYTDLHHLFQTVIEGMVQIQEVAEDFGLNLDESEQAARNLNKTARQLQTELTHARMRPLADVANRFPRALRELSLRHGKQVTFKLHGGNTLIDRTILDGLGEPLMHMVRNAFDHGLEDPETRRLRDKPETATIAIHASHRGNRTLISISDDGRGIDLNKIRSRAIRMGLDEELLSAASEEELLSLIFEPGFSTAEQTTDLSGRGVGMDVVRDRLQQLHGDIKITTRAGHGTTFSLSLPLTLSITRVLLAESNGMLIAIPTDTINEMIVLEPNQISLKQGQEVFEYDGKTATLIRLSQWFTFNCPRSTPDELETPPSIKTPSVLIAKRGTQVMGIEVERSWREQEVTVRRVAGTISLPEGFSNCTILGDGRVVPLINIAAMLHWVMSNQRSVITGSTADHRRLPAVAQLGERPAAPEQQRAGQHHRSPQPPSVNPRQPTAPTVPVPISPQPQSATSIQNSSQPPSGPPAVRESSAPPKQLRVMVVDDSIAVRRLLAGTLEKASYRVEQAKDGLDALEKLTNDQAMDAMICDVEMPRLDGYRLLAKLRADASLRNIPVMMLTSRSGEKHRKLAMGLGAQGYCTKPYNEQILLQQLAEMTSREMVGISRVATESPG